MQKKIIYSLESGGIAVVNPAPKEQLARVFPHVAKMSDDDYLEFIISRDVPADAANVRIVDADELPKDRTFRDAWKHDLTHDVQKCVEITNDRLRAERAPLLAQLDADAVRALSGHGDIAAVEKEKQRLRDITKIAHAGMMLDELKAIKC